MTLKMTNYLYLLAILSFLAGILFFSAGCGKKMWPEPEAREDCFDWEIVKGIRDKDCISIKARITGAYQNLAKLKLELEGSSEDDFCPTCPFRPESQVSFPLSSAQVKHKGSEIELVYCGLNPEMHYRWRLIGVNIFKKINQVLSKVQVAEY